MTTTSKPKWSDVKRELQSLDEKAMVDLVRDLFKLSAGNREFLVARLLSVRTDEMLETYRKRIVHEFFPPRGFGDPKLQVARRAVSDYRKATGNMIGTLDLMLTYVETGTRFTNTYGDFWEGFYRSMESMLDAIAKLLDKEPQLYSEVETAMRLQKLKGKVSHIGWGYGDYVTDAIDKIQAYFGDQ